MKTRIIIKDGKVRVFVDEGPFDEAALRIKSLFLLLAAEGIPLSTIGQPEQHRHDGDEAPPVKAGGIGQKPIAR